MAACYLWLQPLLPVVACYLWLQPLLPAVAAPAVQPLLPAVAGEPLPPGVASHSSASESLRGGTFKTLVVRGNTAKLSGLVLIGIVSELGASLPCRLFVVHVFYFFDRLGGRIDGVKTWMEMSVNSIAIREFGWKVASIFARYLVATDLALILDVLSFF